MYKDLSRSIDYLETRDDIDSEKIAYYGMSLGARLGPVMLTMEERLKLGILVVGGFPLEELPAAVDTATFAPRVKVPVLMVNGKEDFIFPLETSQKPMYEFLGTPEVHKKHITYPGGHGLLGLFTRQIKADVLAWLNHYLGPVK
jgi:dienelactone hydrolase